MLGLWGQLLFQWVPVKHQNIKAQAWLNCPQKTTDRCCACHFYLRKKSLHFSPTLCNTLDFLSSCLSVFLCLFLMVWQCDSGGETSSVLWGGCQQEWDVCLGTADCSVCGCVSMLVWIWCLTVDTLGVLIYWILSMFPCILLCIFALSLWIYLFCVSQYWNQQRGVLLFA